MRCRISSTVDENNVTVNPGGRRPNALSRLMNGATRIRISQDNTNVSSLGIESPWKSLCTVASECVREGMDKTRRRNEQDVGAENSTTVQLQESDRRPCAVKSTAPSVQAQTCPYLVKFKPTRGKR